MSIRTIVYVDAFNLYYGALKDTPYKWLDLLALSRAMLRRDNVVESIKYFTAKVVPRPSDPSAPTRQNLYLRALRTIKADVVLGRFLSHPVRMMLSHPQPGASPFVEVIKTEEKGSDVNIASHLLLDASRNRMDCAVLITGDSDLTTPVQMARHEFRKTVGVLNPQKQDCKTLRAAASFYAHIRAGVLAASQFPDELTDSAGTFRRPKEW